MMVRPLKQISPARWLQLRVQLAERMSNDANDKKSAERTLTATFQSEETIFALDPQALKNDKRLGKTPDDNKDDSG